MTTRRSFLASGLALLAGLTSWVRHFHRPAVGTITAVDVEDGSFTVDWATREIYPRWSSTNLPGEPLTEATLERYRTGIEAWIAPPGMGPVDWIAWDPAVAADVKAQLGLP